MQQEQILGGRYRLTGQLGVGGMSVVWKAHDELLNRHVAVKVLAGPHTASPAARRRVQAEAQAAAQLSHPNVTNVYDYGEAPGDDGDRLPYVVMELLPGRTLSQRLADGPLPPQAALRVCAEVAEALAAAHERHVVHRDVKPANVMLTPSGAKVLDFGLAAVAGQPDLDEEGQLLGTAAYLAPERLTGDEVLPASDIYALGLLVHRALTDELPWEADTPSQMLNAHVYVEPRPLRPISGVPAAVNDICNRCLAKDPADRPSAAEVAAVLTGAAGIVPRPSDDLPLRAVPVPADLPGPGVSSAGPSSNGATSTLAASGLAAPTGADSDLAASTGADSTGTASNRASNGAGSTGGASNGAASDGAGSNGAAATVASARDRRRWRVGAVVAGAAVLAAVAVALLRPGAQVGHDDAAAAPRSAPAGVSPGTSVTQVAAPAATPATRPGGGTSGPAGTAAPAGTGEPDNPGGPGPAGSEPAATPGVSSSTVPEPGVRIRANGGVATVSCTGKKAQILGLELSDGYSLAEYVPGPADEVKAVLVSAANKSEIKAKCARGMPVPNVKETPAKP